jgi:agmatine/peptidylarginine deiminase
MTTSITLRILVVILIGSVLAPTFANAQQTTQSPNPADNRIQDLINTRRSEYWNFWETQLALTPAPRSQPVEALPEWHPVGSVIVTLDADYVNSFKANKALRTEGKGAEIIRHDPDTINYIRTITCNTLYNVESDASESLRHDPEVSARIKQLCKGHSGSETSDLTVAVDSKELAPVLALIWLQRLKEDELLNLLSYAHTFLKILADLTAQTDVVVLVHGSGQDEDAIHEKVELIRRFPSGSTLLNSNRLRFVQMPVKTKWVRDYGPIFVKGIDQQIICVDPRYETNRESQEQKRQLARMTSIIETALKRQAKANKEKTKEQPENEGDTDAQAETATSRESRLYDDVSPSLLAARLRQRNKELLSPYPINVVRPPLALDGGDFFTDGKGVGFTSTATLRANGGNVELVNQVFREYFGIKEVVYLQPLPGSTVKHIDMFFKPVTDKILLLGKYEGPGVGVYAPSLQAEAQRVLAYNLKILKDFYKNRKDQDQRTEVNVIDRDTDEIKPNMVNIVLVPMPDLQRPIREKLDKVEKDLINLTNKYEQQDKSLKKARSHYESLSEAFDYFTSAMQRLREATLELKGQPPEEPVTLLELYELSSDVTFEMEVAYGEPSETSNQTGTSSALKPFNDLAEYIESKGDVEMRDLTVPDKRALEGLVNNAVISLRILILKVREDRSKAQADYYGHFNDMKRLRNEIADMSEEYERLRQLYPHGSDLYRTFLNALQIRTNQANLLLMPVYRGIDELEQRVQNTLRRIYSHAYGNVTILPVDSDYFIQLSGSIHCLTQTIPMEVEVFSDDWNYRSKLAQQP